MKKLTCFLTFLVLMFSVASIDAGVKERRSVKRKVARKAVKTKVAKRRVVKLKAARRIIRRTTVVIRRGHKIVKKNKVYTGYLARAIRHQKYARILFRKKLYAHAARHSLRARRLAFKAIKANKAKAPKEANFEKNEKDIWGDTTEKELDNEIAKAMPKESTKDEDFLSDVPDFDIEEEKEEDTKK